MQILTERMLWLYGIGVNYAKFARTIPCSWDKTNKLQTLSTSQSELRSWKIVVFIIILHELFQTVRIYQLLTGSEESLDLYSIQIINYIGSIICVIMEMTLVIYKESFIHFSNQILFFCKRLDGNQCLALNQFSRLIFFIFLEKHIKKDADGPAWQLRLEALLASVLLICIWASIASTIIAVEFPALHIYVTSLFSNPSGFYTLIFVGIPNSFLIYLILCSSYSSTVFVFAPWVFVTTFILKELK